MERLTKQEIEEGLVFGCIIVCDHLAWLNARGHESFKKVQSCSCFHELSARKTVTRKYVAAKKYHQLKEELRIEVDSHCITMDKWTSFVRGTCLDITLHYVEENWFQSVTSSVREV